MTFEWSFERRQRPSNQTKYNSEIGKLIQTTNNNDDFSSEISLDYELKVNTLYQMSSTSI